MKVKGTVCMTVACLTIAVGNGLVSCVEKKTEKIPAVCELKVDTVVYLHESQQSPSCKITINYAFLKPNSETDSATLRINSEIRNFAFGKTLSALAPEKFVQSITDTYAQNYLNDVKELYEADLHNGMKPEDVPAWYNYEYQIDTEMELGKEEKVWNYVVTDFQYTGGAHPNTFVKCLNIDRETGQLLTTEKVFKKEASAKICPLILNELIKEVNGRMGTDTITSIAGLQSIGILLDTDLYVPENFVLGKDGVSFYYNRYEIAPYSAGDFNLMIPYDKLDDCFKTY